MMLIISIGIISAFVSLFINYCIGKPGSKEFSPYEIFSRYTVWLSIKRLQKTGLYWDYINQYNENINRASTKSEIITLKNDFKKMLYEAADPYFTWERAAGMCSVCSGFWMALAISLIFTLNFLAITGIIVTSHVTIRILNKII